ncbi:hypothetical protein BB561_001023 [Smittium simulii]|uniref:Tethering factor for nuclear proteasome STS1 n=1 Tax=Smittium simulii TaxID=133385 RepID=A0A2T9YWJ8_9FUNG|nr:hypothetical protein BB561_001023 [Smittium simulii]
MSSSKPTEGFKSLGPKWGAGVTSISGYGYGFQSTPTPDSLTSSSTQSPKSALKRKQSSEDICMESISSELEPFTRKIAFRKANGKHDSLLTSPYKILEGKRAKLNQACPKDLDLEKLLEPLEKKELLNLLTNLVKNNLHLEKDIREALPTPTITSACLQLRRLEQKMQSSIPFSKTGTVFNEYTFNRLRPALEELRDTIVMYVDHFFQGGLIQFKVLEHHNSSQSSISHPAEWFEILIYATGIVCRMPVWTHSPFNQLRTNLLSYMANVWHRAILATAQWVELGHALGQDMVSSWEKSLMGFADSSGNANLFASPVLAFKQQLGWSRGFSSVNTNQSSSFLENIRPLENSCIVNPSNDKTKIHAALEFAWTAN